MTDLSELGDFLLARIARDERSAALLVEDSHIDGSLNSPDSYWLGLAERLLRECDAKRRIVALASWTGPKVTFRDRLFGPAADEAFRQGIRASLRLLALPYADHPDYREEWRP